MTQLLLKNTLIKIKKSFGRYISLLIIVMVGVGFFTGLQASTPDITTTLSKYNDSYKLMDFQIVSTMGLTNDDVNALKSLKNVSAVIPSYSLDVLDHGKAIRIQALEKSVDTVKLIEGRMPKTDNECVADSRNYKIGDKINITSDVSGKLKNTEFTVVGTIESPLYLAYDYGETTIGDGKLSSFIFINTDNFTMDTYTQIYVTAAGTKDIAAFSKKYDSIITQINDELVKLKPDRENARYQEIYNKASEEISGNEKALNDKKAKGEKELSDAKNQLDATNLKLNNEKNEVSNEKTELAQYEKKLDDGYIEYNKNLAAFNDKMAEAETQIQDAKEKLSDIEKPNWTIFDRNTAIAGYSDLKSGTDTINSVAAIFPLFFILIVILMTSNTMARMIAEERSELGTLTSLGFYDRKIIFTYLLYVLSATVLGAATGFFAGCAIIPKIIFACFPYILPQLITHFNITAFLLILAIAVILMTSVTVIFCNQELKQNPATLMRPVPPKNGQIILLEKIGPVWKHLSFTWKVTMRNIFRYKQRVFMTIVGIAGCTALLLTGFGIKDSINGVAQKQYGEIFKYNDLIVLKNETQNISGNLKILLTKEHVKDPVLIRQTAFTCESSGKSLDCYLIVPENEETFYNYFNLKNTINGTEIKLNDNGVIISQKLSEVYKIGKGDKIKVKDADNNSYTLTISDVTENYIQNYIYMSKKLYSKVFGKPVSYNMIVSNYNGDEQTLSKYLIGSNLIENVSFKDDILQQVVEENKSLNGVVILIVCIASILAVIVLYNLTSINISERKREISTLKVLGFTDRETSEYIYREAIILSMISIGLGLILGIGLHRFVLGVIERDSIIYLKNIKVLSFVWAFLITMISSVIMQIVTYFIIKKIDMIESLKSVD